MCFQTEDQYIFIHDALLEAVLCGMTEVPARSLHSHLEKLMMPENNRADGMTAMELEFKVIRPTLIKICFSAEIRFTTLMIIKS